MGNSVGRLKRGVHFVIGAALGGAIGYGIATSGPGPTPPFQAPGTMGLTLGLGAVCGALGALFPDRFWRRSRWRVIQPSKRDAD